MLNAKYEAKNRYSGEIVEDYINKRKSNKWDKEQVLFKKKFEQLGKKLKIIDIPVGTGRFFEFYRALNYDVIAVDISNDMLKMAKKNAPKGLKVDYKIGDAESISFSEKRIDCVVSARFLNWLPQEIYYKVLDNFNMIASEHLLIQVRLKKKALFWELLSDIKNELQLKKIKKSIVKYFFKTKIYNDYFVHSYFDTIKYLEQSFNLVSIHEIETRYKYLKLEKHTFFLIHCTRK